MLLSVVLPVRNGAPFVRKAVHSILVQSLRAFELIVVDNSSTDETVAIIKSFRDPRIRIVREPQMGGPTAFNSGWRVARGKYVARMDADDTACQDRLERQVHHLETHPEIGFLGGQVLRTDEKGETIGRSRLPITPAAIRHVSRYVFPVINPTLMFRHNVLKQLGGYREFAPAADYDMLLRALESGVWVANLPDVLLSYRIHSHSVSHMNRQRTLVWESAVKRMAKLRRNGRLADEKVLLERLRKSAVRESNWFSCLNNVVSDLKMYRSQCILNGSGSVEIQLANLCIALVGALHPQIMKNIWAGYRAHRIVARYQRL